MLPRRKTRYLLMKKVLGASGVFMKAPVPAALATGVMVFFRRDQGPGPGCG